MGPTLTPELVDVGGLMTLADLLSLLEGEEEAGGLDPVLLDMLLEDVRALVRGGASDAVYGLLCEWHVPEFLRSRLASGAGYSVRFAVHLLAALLGRQEMFSRLLDSQTDLLAGAAAGFRQLDLDSPLAPPLVGLVTETLQHAAGRRWADTSGCWDQLITSYAVSGGGRHRPALDRLLIVRLRALWAGPADELAGVLHPVTRFLTVPARRLQEGDGGQPWITCCDLLRKLALDLLRTGVAADLTSGQHADLLTTLKGQAAVLMETASAPFSPAQLYLSLHQLSGQSAPDDRVTSAARRASQAICRRPSTRTLRDLSTLLLDACLLSPPVTSCHLAAAAAAPVWDVVSRCQQHSPLTTAETKALERHRALWEEFLGESGKGVAEVFKIHVWNTDHCASEGIINTVKTVFLSRADRPRQNDFPVIPVLNGSGASLPPVLSQQAAVQLCQPWVLLLRHGQLTQPRTVCEVLTLVGNLCSAADPQATSPDAPVASLLGLVDVLVAQLSNRSKTERVFLCALQCLGYCAPLLDPSDGPWSSLASSLTTLLTTPQSGDMTDALGEAVARLARVSAAHSLTDWLTDNRLVSLAFNASLGTGPSGRHTADCLLRAVEGGAPALWEELTERLDLVALLTADLDASLVVGTTALRFLQRHLTCASGAQLSDSERRLAGLFVQVGLCSGEREIWTSAEQLLVEVLSKELDRGEVVTREMVDRWLTDGTATALLRSCGRNPSHHPQLRQVLDAVVKMYPDAELNGPDCKSVELATDNSVGAMDGKVPKVDKARDSASGPPDQDSEAKDDVIMSVLQENVSDFFSGRGSECVSDLEDVLQPRPEVSVSAQHLLRLSRTLLQPKLDASDETLHSECGDEMTKLQLLVRQVTARVEEIQRCSVMDTELDVPTDCY